MQIEPLQQHAQGPLRKVPVYDSSLDINRYLVFPVNSMEMWWRMVSRINRDGNPQESRYLWHLSTVV